MSGSLGAVQNDGSNYYNYRTPGIGSVGSYQISGTPYLTGTNQLANGSEELVSFPAVTRAVTVRNLSNNTYLKVHFESATTAPNVLTGYHYATLSGAAGGTELKMEVKCNHLYVTNDCGSALDYEIIGELTGIGVGQMFPLTGSGIS
jgi:hypothetical protein